MATATKNATKNATKKSKTDELSTLKRMELSPSNTIADNEILAKAKRLFGYKGGIRKDIGVAGILGQVLRELHLKPFDPKRVNRYKIKKQEQFRATLPKTSSFSSYRWRIGWATVPIEEYRQDIPDFVMRKAIQIKEKMPAAQIVIEELTAKKERVARRYDPFLVAKFENEKYYIEVWNEREFEDEVIDE